MKIWYFLACLVVIQNVNCLDASPSDFLNSGIDIVGGIIDEIPNVIPTPEEFFEFGKNVIAGYPFVIASSLISEFCSAAISQDAVKPKVTPDIGKMNFELRTGCKNYTYPLSDPTGILDNPEFDVNKPLVIVADGWTSDINSSNTLAIIGKAYICRGDVNFIGVDVNRFIDTLYTWSAFNTDKVGEYIAQALVKLTKTVPVKNIHLIGHSLGAHIMGYAARYYQEATGELLPRVTGLDPARPCFNEGEELSGLQRGDADFIDIIHSNPGVLGIRDPLGDIDYYPNGLHPLPPGCFAITCAHARSVQYYGESVYKGNEKNFLATRCSSLKRYQENRCRGDKYPMGYAVPTDIKGNYFSEVNADSPYGKGGDPEREQEYENCGLCEDN